MNGFIEVTTASVLSSAAAPALPQVVALSQIVTISGGLHYTVVIVTTTGKSIQTSLTSS